MTLQEKFNFQQDIIAVKPIDKGESTKGVIFLPSNFEGDFRMGKVEAVGPGVYSNGIFVAQTVQCGDVVLYDWGKGKRIIIEGEEYVLLSGFRDVLAVQTRNRNKER